MADDHAFARINLALLQNLTNALPVQFEHFIFIQSSLARTFPIEWIFSPIGRTAAEAGEADVFDRDHIRLHQEAVVSKKGFVTQLVVPIPIYIQHRAFDSPNNLTKIPAPSPTHLP